jgi:hypothetical protein
MKRVEKALYSENQTGALSKMFGHFKQGHNCRKYGSVYCKAKGQVHFHTPVQLASERRVAFACPHHCDQNPPRNYPSPSTAPISFSVNP